MSERKLIRYNFDNYNNEVNTYLESVYSNSLKYYGNHFKGKNKTQTVRLDLETIDKSIGYIEDYLNYFYKKHPKHFLDVFKALKKNVNTISVLPPADRGIYGQYVSFVGLIFINPELRGSRTLTKDERTRLYLCHELGHAVHDEWIKKVSENLDDVDSTTKSIIIEGFNLIDEATTQNTAENVAYYYSNNKRPKQQYYSGMLFSGAPYKSNFDFYGNLQEPATMFSRTLRGIGKLESDNRALNILSLRALKNDFANKVFYEYKRDGHKEDLEYLMSYLGIIKKASYATFGYDDKKYINSSLGAFTELKKLAGSLRDYRPPFK